MMLGGVSDPRNRGLMKMFNLIDIGERAGSGIPKIFNIWKDISPRAKRTAENQKKILDYLKDNGRSGCAEIAGYIGLSAARTRAILSEMKEVEAIGKNRNRTYRIK